MIKVMEINSDIPMLQSLRAHSTDVTSCDFGAKFYLASGSGDKTIHVWEWKVGQGYVDTNYSPLPPHKYAITCVRFSPQGTMLASSSIDGSTILWNVGTGVRIASFVQPNGSAVRVCRFSPDSTLLATADDDGTIVLWDLVIRNLVRTFKQHEGSVQAICFTPDSNYLLTTCTQSVLKLWAVADRDTNEDTNSCVTSLDDAHDMGVMGCDFSVAQDISEGNQDCYLLATCGNDNLVKLWLTHITPRHKHQQTTTCRITLKTQLTGHTSAVTSIRFSPSGIYLASTSIDKTTRIWDATSGQCLTILEGHSRYVTSCSFSRDGSLLATGSNDKTMIVWDLTKNLNKDSVLVPPTSAISQLNLVKSKQTSEQEVVKHAEKEMNQVKLLQRLDDFDGSVNSCHFYKNSLLATGSGDKSVRVWLRGNNGRFSQIAISPFQGHRYSVNQVEFSPNGQHLASCSLDGTTLLWDVKSGSPCPPKFHGTRGGTRTCRFSSDGHLLATAGDDNMATIISTTSMTPLMNVCGHSDSIVCVSFTRDSQYLMTGSTDGSMKLWSVAPCNEQCRLVQEEAHDLGVQSCDFSSVEERNTVSQYLCASCGNDSLVKLWHINTPRYHADNVYSSSLWRTLSGHGGHVMCVRFAPGMSDILASTATDHTARLWNVYTGECVHVLEHTSMVNTCAFIEDSSLLATGTIDKTLLIWELPQQLVFQTVAAVRLRGYRKKLMYWTSEDISKWLKKMKFYDLIPKLRTCNLESDISLMTKNVNEICEALQVDDSSRQNFTLQLYWLKKEDAGFLEIAPDVQIPYEYLCPITLEVMRDPVSCSDGFTYERAAINEWFLSGRFTSPMTNADLSDTSCVTNMELRSQICYFLYGDQTQGTK